MHKLIAFFVLIVCSVLTVPAYAQSQGLFQNAAQKQEEKKSVRWSLADWLAQKDRMRMSDMWLAKNSHSSPFEFFLEARSINYSENDGSATDPKVNHNLYGGSLAAYAGVAGLKGSYDSDSEDRSSWRGSLNVRFLGRALQDTHLNLEYGLRGSDLGSNGEFTNQFAGLSTNLYLTKYFGLEGSHYRLLSAKADSGRKMQGEESRAGVFIDFAFMRIFGQWQHELLYFQGGGAANATEKRQGFGGGLRFYF